jgi:hypothetical protein
VHARAWPVHAVRHRLHAGPAERGRGAAGRGRCPSRRTPLGALPQLHRAPDRHRRRSRPKATRGSRRCPVSGPAVSGHVIPPASVSPSDSHARARRRVQTWEPGPASCAPCMLIRCLLWRRRWPRSAAHGSSGRPSRLSRAFSDQSSAFSARPASVGVRRAPVHALSVSARSSAAGGTSPPPPTTVDQPRWRHRAWRSLIPKPRTSVPPLIGPQPTRYSASSGPRPRCAGAGVCRVRACTGPGNPFGGEACTFSVPASDGARRHGPTLSPGGPSPFARSSLRYCGERQAGVLSCHTVSAVNSPVTECVERRLERLQ